MGNNQCIGSRHLGVYHFSHAYVYIIHGKKNGIHPAIGTAHDKSNNNAIGAVTFCNLAVS